VLNKSSRREKTETVKLDDKRQQNARFLLFLLISFAMQRRPSRSGRPAAAATLPRSPANSDKNKPLKARRESACTCLSRLWRFQSLCCCFFVSFFACVSLFLQRRRIRSRRRRRAPTATPIFLHVPFFLLFVFGFLCSLFLFCSLSE